MALDPWWEGFISGVAVSFTIVLCICAYCVIGYLCLCFNGKTADIDHKLTKTSLDKASCYIQEEDLTD